ncbi:translation initiation factor IF-3 [Paenibacillus crassostreae]|uniref:Translation initiation factor IF-3 n=1 Tax=Paenibacillus crassostreae TaxID=1763538 RepID=A0A167BUR8_9BACL|nr:translation initiation factor IF-3 [Paenibacillus crassostreae]AOZ92517.1 translation initiation factor IF-3 [Paenibacillus crassostreae]OAB72465.1 translation initiation factor IF-3 [Paenibacillus crassostreae]
MIKNEQIRASEVQLTGIHGEDLGVISTSEALALAKKHKVDLICTSLLSSPPPCRLMKAGAAKQEVQKSKPKSGKQEQSLKVKEIHLTPQIEDHDYDTKKNQAYKLLQSGKAVLIVVRIQGKEGPKAKELLERLLKDLIDVGSKQSGIQLSGKQAMVQVNPL